METPQEDKDESAIRHYKGTVKQFKDMFDDLAGGEDTNAYNSPVRQGYDIQNTRGDVKSPHWDEEHEDGGHPEDTVALHAARRLLGLGAEEQVGADVVVRVSARVSDASGADPARMIVAERLATHAAATLAAA